MLDLIDRDALREELGKFHIREARCELYFGESEMDILDAAPTVSCEECRHLEVVWTNNRGEEGHGCTHPDVDEACAAGEYSFIPAEGFGCSFFERREP